MTLLTKKYKRLHEGTLWSCAQHGLCFNNGGEIQSSVNSGYNVYRCLAATSGSLGPVQSLQWFRIKTNIIIQLLYAIYQEMLESRWLNLKEMESCGTNMSAVVVCCFLQGKHTSHLLDKQMSAPQCIHKFTWHSFHTALIKISPPGCSCRYHSCSQIPQMLISVIMKCGVIWSDWRSQDFQNCQII